MNATTVKLSTITSREYYTRILWIAKGLISGDCVGNNTPLNSKLAMVMILNVRFGSRHGLESELDR
jgi:hypothetical protein